MAVYQFVVIIVLGFMASMILTSIEIPILKHRQFQQFIREEGPKSHLAKEGTPTMGGIAIYLAIIICSLIGLKASRELVVLLVAGLAFGLIGFLDDYMSYTFDGIMMECSLSTFPQPDEALHEAYCVLKKGGRLIITDYYEIDPDPKQVKAVAIEAARQARLPHNEGDCEEGTVSHFTDFCFEGAFYKEPLQRMLEDELGLRVQSFEDAGLQIGADDLFTDVKTEAAGKSRNLGYFILVAQKPVM